MIPTELPDALISAFAHDPQKQQQWTAFVGNLGHAPKELPVVVNDLAAFLMGVAAASKDAADAVRPPES